MMRFDIMTLFPELVETVLGASILGRAQKSGAISVRTHQIRDYAEDKHNRVDDTPYGGGKGMLMMAPPIYRCYRGVLRQQEAEGLEELRRRVIYLSPAGRVLDQGRAAELASGYNNLILLCGHYEGVDHRIVEEIVDEEISIGDYVLTGGRSRPAFWPTALPGWCRACWRTPSATKRKASPPACWNIPSIPGPTITTACACRTYCSRATMPTLRPGGGSSPCA